MLELPKLPGLQRQRPKPKTQTYEYAEPIYLTKLRDKMGSSAAIGCAIGMNRSTISKAILENKTRKVVEEAARGYWERNYEPKEAPPLLMDDKLFVSMLVPKGVMKVLLPWLRDAGVEVKVFKGKDE